MVLGKIVAGWNKTIFNNTIIPYTLLPPGTRVPDCPLGIILFCVFGVGLSVLKGNEIGVKMTTDQKLVRMVNTLINDIVFQMTDPAICDKYGAEQALADAKAAKERYKRWLDEIVEEA